MNPEGLQSTLFRALDKTSETAGLAWRRSARPTRYIADIGKWRLRIESIDGSGDHPFKFSLFAPRAGGELASLTSFEAAGDLTEEEKRVNQALRELWEKVEQKVTGPGLVAEVNQLLDSL